MIRITACQTKRTQSSDKNLEACIKWIERISRNAETDIICFGELYPFSFDVAGSLEENERVSLLKQACRENKSRVIIGFIEQDRDKLRNLSVCIDQEGKIAHKHAKDIKYGDEKRRLESSLDGTHLMKHRTSNMGLSICYSLLFPEYGRMLALQGSQLVIAQSNVPLALREVWRGVVITRVFENHMPYIHVSTFDERKNYGGLTCIVTPPFTVAEEIRNPFKEEYITATIDVIKHTVRRFKKAPAEKGSDLFKNEEYGPFLSELPEPIIQELMAWYQTLKKST